MTRINLIGRLIALLNPKEPELFCMFQAADCRNSESRTTPAPKSCSADGLYWKRQHVRTDVDQWCVQLMTSFHVLITCWSTRPAPLLKNASLSESKARELYLQVVQNMRKMFQDARLVHADLSEFNMLWDHAHYTHPSNEMCFWWSMSNLG